MRRIGINIRRFRTSTSTWTCIKYNNSTSGNYGGFWVFFLRVLVLRWSSNFVKFFVFLFDVVRTWRKKKTFEYTVLVKIASSYLEGCPYDFFSECVCAIFFFWPIFSRCSSRVMWEVWVAELGWVYYQGAWLPPVLVVYPPPRSAPNQRIRSPVDYSLKVVRNFFEYLNTISLPDRSCLQDFCGGRMSAAPPLQKAVPLIPTF